MHSRVWWHKGSLYLFHGLSATRFLHLTKVWGPHTHSPLLGSCRVLHPADGLLRPSVDDTQAPASSVTVSSCRLWSLCACRSRYPSGEAPGCRCAGAFLMGHLRLLAEKAVRTAPHRPHQRGCFPRTLIISRKYQILYVLFQFYG